ncbi:MAG: hypothetical protein M3Y20_03590 [Actinomycetota bacterium]|nr:hypothetical protein [Actinomycetota bacterium]
MSIPQRTVVVVHGIGQQTSGATATAWIDSFLRFCDAQGRRAEVVGNRLWSDDDEASATLVVGGPGTAQDAVVLEPVLRLRVVEARWADAFVAPGASSVLRWLLWYGPNLAHAQVFLSRRAHSYLRKAAVETMGDQGAPDAQLTSADAAAHRASTSVSVVGPVLYLLGGLVLLGVAGPLVLVLAALALVAALVPVNAVRSVAARVLAVVSAQVGDVSTFLTSPVSRGAMEEIIDKRIRTEVARAGVDDVHVLAHSQGAALTHAVLARMPPALRPKRFTTLGGAHGRLHTMRLLEFPRWTLLPVLATALSWLAAFPIHGRFGWPGLLVAPGAVSLATLVLLLWSGAASVRRLGRAPTPGTVPGVAWLDIWAPFDPVHNGCPVAAPSSEYLGQTIPGRMAFVLDHVYYEKDWNETVPRVLAHITHGLEGRARLGATRGVRERKSLHDPAGEGPNWTPWSRRDWVSFGCRGLALLVGVVLVAASGTQVMALGARLRGTATWSQSAAERADALWTRWWELFGGHAGDVVGGTDRVVGGLVVLVAAVVVANLVKSLYWGAVGAEARDWALSVATGEARRWTTARWIARGGVIVLVWAALLAALVWSVVSAPWA